MNFHGLVILSNKKWYKIQDFLFLQPLTSEMRTGDIGGILFLTFQSVKIFFRLKSFRMRVSRRIAAYSKPLGLLVIIALVFHFSSDVDEVKVKIQTLYLRAIRDFSRGQTGPFFSATF